MVTTVATDNPAIPSDPFRILIFVETSGPGGAESVVLSLARGFKRRGIDVQALLLSRDQLDQHLEREGIVCHFITSTRRFDLTLPFRIAKLLRQQHIDLLHSHLLDSNFYGALAARIARVDHVATEHGDVHHPQRKLYLKLKLQIAGFLGSYFTAVSGYTLQKLRSMGIRATRAVQISNPVIIPEKLEESAQVEQRRRLRQQLFPGIDDKCFLWIHVANLRPVKDQKTLLRGFAGALRLTSMPQRLVIVGEGQERAYLESLCRELAVGNEVRLFGYHPNARELLTGADGFILSSRSEGLPVALLEAGAAGLYLVSSRVGGVDEIITPGKTGALFRPGDHAKLAQLIRDAIENRDRTSQIANHTRTFIEQQYSEDKVVDDYLEFFSRIV